MLMSAVANADSTDQLVNDVVHDYMQENDVPGVAVMIYTNGKPATYYFGMADRATKKPINKDTIFELGSVTKVMTTLMLAQDLDYARMKLNDPIKKYIPTLPDTFSHITVRSLATHTSGLPLNLPSEIKTRTAWENQYAVNWHPGSAPDESYQYSNVGIGLIGQALEKVAHANFNTLYRKNILKPLGMQPIALTVPAKLTMHYATGYRSNGTPAPREGEGLFPAAYGVKASAGDMQKFLSAAIGLPSTPTNIFYPMRMTQTPYVSVNGSAQGLGWQIHDLSGWGTTRSLMKGNDLLGLNAYPVSDVYGDPVFHGTELIDKTGTTAGFRAYIAVLPDKKSGIVMLANRTATDASIVKASREILFKLNGII
tara:strand:- start:1309 stop:2415 length:1107 start_codon:yes stop_codon:yes gene_type:complete